MRIKSRVRDLSTRYFFAYKYATLILPVVVFLFSLTTVVNKVKAGYVQGYWYALFLTSIVLLVNWFRLSKRVHHVKFDDNFLYVIRKNKDTVIPLENIKDVQISDKGGTYEIDLYNKEDFGDKIYFKPSLFYPIGFRKEDMLINVLRKNIELAKAKVQPVQKNALHS